MSLEAYGFTIFCDDIRQEIGGKASYIGVYKSVMYLHGEFPIALPKFGLAITYREPREWPNERVRFEVYLPGATEAAIIGEFAAERGPTTLTPRTLPDDSDVYFETGTVIVLSPLFLPCPGFIRVKAIRGSKTVRLGTLCVEPPPEQ
ncbi:MAG: hypothetical protein ACLQF1_09270 [Methyloceanibacter sp.]|jgi:hypothetical protein